LGFFKGLIETVGDAIWSKLEPKIDQRLDNIEQLAKEQLDAWRTESLQMLSQALPAMAGEVAEQTVNTVFAHTQVDEAADAVSGVITDIVNRIRFPFLR